MKFKLVDTLAVDPKLKGTYEQARKVMDLLENADLIKVKLKDGAEHICAKVNFNGGVCDDCVEFRTKDIRNYEFYQLDD